ncbi:DedA family protein [Frigidibacter sp. ROC022]|uniref:DedA family protein n=1 Tax=Frigidibacter sp. ROC022 TaxID=2971796 RepID=UPI00215B53C7|nr:VTT domain-containing protein [Frigidibacter sp. ROC022]MCR8726414.1 VTT domain-containing protein [Frigidibacter sp. ROC022]
MTDLLLGLVPSWGPVLLFLATFLSCLALPAPASLLMLAAGAFAAGGDLLLSTCILGAFSGAVLGDQVGFQIGRYARDAVWRLAKDRSAKALLERAQDYAARRGRLGVFLSRWLFSPLGPYVNFIGGATGMGWLAFTTAGVLGEMVWVTVYVGTGYGFADRFEQMAELAGSFSGAVSAGLVALILGAILLRLARRHRKG